MTTLQNEMYSATLILAIGCVIMAGAGWWCQKVRYPAFRSWSAESFLRNHQRHTLQISPIVIPGMLLQMAGTTWLATLPDVLLGLKVLHIALCLASIGPTLLVSGPIHGRLSAGKDAELIEKLIRSNRPRTVVWSFQAVACPALFVFQ
ncbi:MAG: hypothetical protein IT363_05600 [Methanoregulaceae archaeon]|nr:hypothetical protein [Methanoregulaceae archaeon]